MLLTIVSVIYVLVAIAMIVLILMQRGSGAAAGSGFGGGASATVFGARGSANFLSTATKWLAAVFMIMSLAMAWNATRGVTVAPIEDDLGVMSDVPTAASVPSDAAPAGDVPVIPAADVPAVEPAPAADAAPVEETPVENAEKDSQGG
ncbi:MAG TPA: preprotein translocase subunit SecG [Arenimonas sp.]|uniref:preprotein translocase subunit SecG n=1 Tax=Arenimonas sp. TaxID=1872635 RepID=UPI002D7F1E86|nr:preprotein translocase subunit SecG [Arenimonas sp.]HEU0151858.1 preprotein translocase subunit SecG [Arenimonas sp.]